MEKLFWLSTPTMIWAIPAISLLAAKRLASRYAKLSYHGAGLGIAIHLNDNGRPASLPIATFNGTWTNRK